VSKVFLANGSVIDQLPIFEPGVMVNKLPLRTSITPAMAIGPGFDLAVNFAALVLFASGLIFRLRARSRSRSA
jgi:apolipoprotein N-acyltransferase